MMLCNRLRTTKLNPSSDLLVLPGNPSRVTNSDTAKERFIT